MASNHSIIWLRMTTSRSKTAVLIDMRPVRTKPSLRDGESCIVTKSRKGRNIYLDELASRYTVRISDDGSITYVNEMDPMERHTDPSPLTTYVMKIRGHATTSWNGRDHVFVVRDGAWVNLNGDIGKIKYSIASYKPRGSH